MSVTRRRFCIFGCDFLDAQGVPTHRFPNSEKHPELFAAWVSVVGDKLKESSPQQIYKNKRICDHHFEKSTKTSRGRLICSAKPTIKLHRVLQSIDTIVEAEHSYCKPRRDYLTNMPGTSSADRTSEFPIPSGCSSSTFFTTSEKISTRSRRTKSNAGIENEIEPHAGNADMPEIENEVVIEIENEYVNEILTETEDYYETNFEETNDNDETHTLDEIDTLFLSYSKTFKKLSSKLQTMLKLDLAKLFSRYEIREQANLEASQITPGLLKRPLVRSPAPQFTKKRKKSSILNAAPSQTNSAVRNSKSKNVSVIEEHSRAEEISTHGVKNSPENKQDTISDQTVLPDDPVENVFPVALITQLLKARSADNTSGTVTETQPVRDNLVITWANESVKFENDGLLDNIDTVPQDGIS